MKIKTCPECGSTNLSMVANAKIQQKKDGGWDLLMLGEISWQPDDPVHCNLCGFTCRWLHLSNIDDPVEEEVD